MPKKRLTQQWVDSLKPTRKTRDIRDPVIRGFGGCVLPSDRERYFLHSQVDGKRIWHSIGDVGAMTLACDRDKATSLLASRSTIDGILPVETEAILFEDVADEVFRRFSFYRFRSDRGLAGLRMFHVFDGSIGTVGGRARLPRRAGDP